MHNNSYLRGTIWRSLLLALLLMLIPLPVTLARLRPDFIILTLMYWWLAHPERVGIIYGMILGVLLDVLYGSLLGQHALGYVLVAWVFIKNHQKIRVLPLWQQSLTVLMLLLVKQFIAFWVDVLRGHDTVTVLLYFAPCLCGAALWPYIFDFLRNLRRRAKNKAKKSA